MLSWGFGAPLKIVSNKRLQFMNEVMKDLFNTFCNQT